MTKDESGMDWDKLEDVINCSIRFLDNVLDVNHYVLPLFEQKALGNRKVGLGVCGFANVLIKLGIKYDSQECLDFIDKLFSFKQDIEELCNFSLGIEKGNFPNWNESIYAETNTRARCSTISTIAPTGSVAGILNTTAYGIEPHFMVCYKRRIVTGETIEANQLFKDMLRKAINNPMKEQQILQECYEKGTVNLESVPNHIRELFRCANDISAEWHVKVLAQLQKYTQNGISKTCNLPSDYPKENLFDLIITGWKLRSKGLTVYRNNSRANQTMQIGNSSDTQSPSNELKRGEIAKAPDMANGTTTKFVSGCGSVYLNVTWDEDGKLNQTFTNKGSSGTCRSNQEAVSRLISLSLRGGISVEDIVDQLKSVDICPSYAVARKSGKCVSKGASCPHAMAFILEDIQSKHKVKLAEVIIEKDVIAEEDDNESKCPKCAEKISQVEGCISCVSCGFSKC